MNVKMTNTAIVTRILRDHGITVNRGDDITLAVNMDSRTIDLPTKMMGTMGTIQYQLLDLISTGQGYTELSRRTILQKGHKNKSIGRTNFEAVLPKVLSKGKFLPTLFEKAYLEENLYMIKGKQIPSSFKKIFKDLTLPRILGSEIRKENFTPIRTADDTIVQAPMGTIQWFVTSDSEREELISSGCDEAMIWDVNRIVRDMLLEMKDYSIMDLAAILPGAKLEASPVGNKAVLMVPCTEDKKYVEVTYEPDPYLMPNDHKDNRVWTINGRVVVENHFVPGLGIVSPAKAVWCMLNYLMESRNEADIEGKLAYAPGMFLRGFYSYAQWDDKTKTMAKDAVGIWNIRSNNQELTPVLFKEEGSENVSKCVAYYLNKGIPAISDAQVQTAYVKNGAIMRGFDLVWNEEAEDYDVANCNDVSKPGKTTNRGQLSAQPQALVLRRGTNTYYHKDPGGSILFGDEKDHLLVSSGLRMVGTLGKPVESIGLRCRVWLTNWVLSNGSGVVSVPKWFKTQLAVRKQESFTVVAINCNGQEPEDYLKDHFKTEALHKSIWPGSPIAWLDSIPVAHFSTAEQHIHEAYGIYGSIMEVGEPQIKNIQTNVHGEAVSFDMSCNISLLMSYNEVAAKFRAPGCKWTVMQEDFELYEQDMTPVPQDQYPDMVTDTENAKQADELITTVKMCADTLPEGWDFNIKMEPNQGSKRRFDDFRQLNQSFKWIFTETLQDEIYDALYEEYKDNSYFQFRSTTKQVGQLCTVIEGDLVLSVEVSTVRENMGTQAIIPEQLAALACIHRPLALEIWNKNLGGRDAIWGMLNMADTEADDCPDIWDLGAEDNPKIPFNHKDLISRGPKAIFKTLHKKFPNGLTIKAFHWQGPLKINFKFDAMIKFSGANDPVGAGTLTLLKHLAIPAENREDGWDNMVGRYLAMISGALEKWALAEGNLQGMCRSERILHGRKVKPVSRAWIKPGQVGIHPEDPLVMMANNHQAKVDARLQTLVEEYELENISQEVYEHKLAQVQQDQRNRKGLTQGDYILISRSPMISVVLLEVVLTDKAPVGTYMVSDLDWHKGNEGDGDGDPSAAFKVPSDMVDAVRDSLTNSVFGPVGYYEAYGTADIRHLPIMEFYRDKDNKKRLGFYPSQDDSNHMWHREWVGPTLTPRVKVVQNIKDIGTHYERFVGKAFAMGSAMVFKTEYMFSVLDRLGTGYFADDVSAGELYRPGFHTACAKMWRRVYEGLALSGISDTALTFARHIGSIGRKDGIVLVQDKGDMFFNELRQDLGINFESWLDETDHETELASFKGDLAVEVAFKLAGVKLTIEECLAIQWAIHVTYLYSQIENKSLELEWYDFVMGLPEHLQDDTLLDDALFCGSLRRLGAGIAKRKTSSYSMVTRLAEEDMFANYMPGWSIAGSILEEAAPAMVVAEDLREKRYF